VTMLICKRARKNPPCLQGHYTRLKTTLWPLPVSKLCQSRGPRLLAKLVPTSVDRGCRVVGATDPRDRILGFLDLRRYFFLQVAHQLYSRG
jgi:hypothetical protein